MRLQYALPLLFPGVVQALLHEIDLVNELVPFLGRGKGSQAPRSRWSTLRRKIGTREGPWAPTQARTRSLRMQLASSPGEDSNEPKARWTNYIRQASELEAAIDREDFDAAAKLKVELDDILMSDWTAKHELDALDNLASRLEAAIAREDFTEAKLLRAELDQVFAARLQKAQSIRGAPPLDREKLSMSEKGRINDLLAKALDPGLTDEERKEMILAEQARGRLETQLSRGDREERIDPDRLDVDPDTGIASPAQGDSRTFLPQSEEEAFIREGVVPPTSLEAEAANREFDNMLRGDAPDDFGDPVESLLRKGKLHDDVKQGTLNDDEDTSSESSD